MLIFLKSASKMRLYSPIRSLKGLRRTRRPSKQLLWILVSRDFPKHSHVEKSMDLACGQLFNLPLFRSGEFLGVDLIAGELAKGSERLGTEFLAQRKVELRVSDFLELTAASSADFVSCLETIGINSHFDSKRALEASQGLIKHVRTGGNLIFNARFADVSAVRDLERELELNFRAVKTITYGRWSKEVHPFLALFGGLLLFLLPPLRSTRSSQAITYFRCLGRL